MAPNSESSPWNPPESASATPLSLEVSRMSIPESDIVIAGPPSEFRLFGNLPIELRLKIWRTSFRQRQVMLSPASCYDPFGFKDIIYTQTYPETLLVRKESRTETLKFYVTVEYDPTFTDAWGNKFRQKIYLNPRIDSVLFELTKAIPRSEIHDIWLAKVDAAIPNGLAIVREVVFNRLRGVSSWMK